MGKKHDPREAQLDHKTSKANGGTNRSSNIRVISAEENQRKGEKELRLTERFQKNYMSKLMQLHSRGAVFICHHVAKLNFPILRAKRDEPSFPEDTGWQFVCNRHKPETQPLIWALEEIVAGLDYFVARYYSSIQGRFISPDKPLADQFQANPRSWNTYSYVRNSPCNNIDTKGRCSGPSGLKVGQVGICIEAFIAPKKIQKMGMTAYGDGRTFSGDDPSLSAKFRTHIIAERTPGNSNTLDVAQQQKQEPASLRTRWQESKGLIYWLLKVRPKRN